MNEGSGPEIRVSIASGLSWEFITPSSATTCAEQADEMIQFCEKLFGAFDDFLIPIEITYPIQIFDQDRKLRPNSDSSDVVLRELRNDNGICGSEFAKSAEGVDSGVRWIPRIPFDKNRYKIHFSGAEHTIDRSDCTPYHKNDPRPQSSIPDPLNITAQHRPVDRESAVTTDHVLTVSVAMHSDLWLHSSENGQNNRAYLVEFFEDIANAVSATSIKRDKYANSDFWNDLSVYSDDEEYIELEPEAIY